MRKALVSIALLISIPGHANSPTIDEAVKAYATAGWYKSDDSKGVCIALERSDYVDRIVTWLAVRAKAQCA
jgi:hypothetical protein